MGTAKRCYAKSVQPKPSSSIEKSKGAHLESQERHNLHHVHIFIFVEFTFFFGGGILVLLVLGDKVVHVGFGFGEFHFVHTFTGVPVKKGLTTEHSSELFGDTFEHLLDGGGVTNEGSTHFQSFRRDVTDGRFDVVGDPFNKVRRIFVLDVQHLFIDFFGGHAATEHAASRQVTAVTGVGGTHHVLGVELLLGQFRDGQGTVLLGTTTGQWGESNHKKVKTWERNHIDGDFTQIGIQLTWETKAARDTGHGGRDQVVKIPVGWGGQFQGTETDVVQGFVVQDHDFIGVFNQLVNGQSGIVWFDDGVGHFWGWEDREGHHDSVRVFFTDLGDQQSSHTGSSTTTQRVSDLETLKAIARFGFFTNDVQNGIDQFGTFGVVTFGPVITGTGLSEDKVIGAEQLTEGSGTDGIHGTRFQIHKDGTRDVTTAGGFVKVNVDAFQLKIGITVVGTGGVDTVLVGDDFPEFGTDLVTALTTLDVNDFSLRKGK